MLLFSKGKEIFFKYHNLSYFVLTILVTLIITNYYSKKQFEKWQIKIATATSENIKLQQRACDTILRTINEKVDNVKSRSMPEDALTLEYLDNVKNEVVMLKDTINNAKSLWLLMYPVYTEPKYAEKIKEVETYDRNILQIIGDIKALKIMLDQQEKSGETEDLNKTASKLQDKIKSYEKQLQSYRNLPVAIYPSSIVSNDTVVTGSVVLPDGKVFKPYSVTPFVDINKQNYKEEIQKKNE